MIRYLTVLGLAMGLLFGSSSSAEQSGRPDDLKIANFQFGPHNRWAFSHVREVIPTVGRNEKNVGKFVYKSGSTDVLGWALEEATGEPLAQLISNRSCPRHSLRTLTSSSEILSGPMAANRMIWHLTTVLSGGGRAIQGGTSWGSACMGSICTWLPKQAWLLQYSQAGRAPTVTAKRTVGNQSTN